MEKEKLRGHCIIAEKLRSCPVVIFVESWIADNGGQYEKVVAIGFAGCASHLETPFTAEAAGVLERATEWAKHRPGDFIQVFGVDGTEQSIAVSSKIA